MSLKVRNPRAYVADYADATPVIGEPVIDAGVLVLVSELRVGMVIRDSNGKRMPITAVERCHHDTHGRYVHINGKGCWTMAAKVRRWE